MWSRVASIRQLAGPKGVYQCLGDRPVALFREIESFAVWPQLMAEEFALPHVADWFRRMAPLVESGRPAPRPSSRPIVRHFLTFSVEGQIATGSAV